ncbi:hypothetical protein GNI_146750 [Gregarina niphandrodes]|uniref:ADF-H domain-containing protein n=1 Tax=Gregarina niphandrodes TaxID=110365 RepID=A0A023B089_GRENI|nr:hypothetical protein GNI_146750 [Gregarina niphandrodes]EZG44528.1 hypothetical protein GNI_146750 [Gregarina niphandrodes]|eukprot:XP_011134169.1 hypothetical protein GNI_146750 [Gregarina niphandrodes]
MGPRVKFAVDPAASEMLDKQLISNDLGGRERIGYMIFKLGNESWDLVDHGKHGAGLLQKLVDACPANQGRHLIFRSADDATDVWVKYIPDECGVKEKTYFATASDSLFDDTRGCKKKLECREKDELKETLAQYL